MARRPYRPLRGIRVLSFEIAFSLPAGTRTLAELGAEVVRLSGPTRPSGTYISIIDGVFLSKPCIGLDLRQPGGRDLARRLVARADVVCHNFTPGVMAGFGLSPAELRAIRDDLVVLQLTGYGTPGPWADYPAFGPSTEAAGGLNALMGDESDEPVRVASGVFADQLAGRFATLAILAALERRRRTGEGATIDLSMTEAISSLLGGAVAGAHRSGKLPPRPGNRDLHFAPQGVYRAKDGEWIAITVRGDAEWSRLVGAVGDPALRDGRYATIGGRRAAHGAIDAALRRWVGAHERWPLAHRLQALGIPAGPVCWPGEALFDEHLAARGAFQRIEHDAPILGHAEHPHARNPWSVAGRPRADLREYRNTGADNARVLRRWLGLSARETQRLVAAGALIDGGPTVFIDRPVPPGTPVDPLAGERLGLRRAHEAAP